MKSYAKYIIIIILSLSVLSCEKFEKSKFNKIEGKWRQVIPLITDSAEKIIWNFTSDSLILSSVYYPDTVYIDTGKYWVDCQDLSYYLYVKDLSYLNDGTYQLLKTSKDMMFMQRIEANFPGPFLRREFIKESD
ncbi:MAG: hypothetical protein Kow0068_09940 [Marinilabiliales bacterium]